MKNSTLAFMMASLISSVAFGLPAQVTPSSALANLMVVGVIVSDEPGQSVALFKKQGHGRVYARKMGAKMGTIGRISSIDRKNVEVSTQDGERYHLVVGAVASVTKLVRSAVPEEHSGIDRDGLDVSIASDFRDHIVKEKLGEVLMQAAAVPYYVEGNLQGFSVHDMEKGSVYEKIGLEEGDLVTAINGYPLTAVGTTIAMLQQLKNEDQAEIALVRSGQVQTLRLVVK